MQSAAAPVVFQAPQRGDRGYRGHRGPHARPFSPKPIIVRL